MRIPIKGTIISNGVKWIYDLFGMDSTCPKDVADAMASAGAEGVDVDINSGGGEIFAGSEIYSMLRSCAVPVRIHVVGFAGSAASVIMCAGDCDIAPTGMVMIHNVTCTASGDYRDFRHQAEVTEAATNAMAQAYVEKTGRPLADFREMMDRETWMTAQQAVELGLCDRIAGQGEGLQLVAANAPVIPAEVVEKVAQMRESWESEKQSLIDEREQLLAAFARYAKLEGRK